ncbi:hypothetical protein ACSV5M_09540 [Cellvibrio sp. ARAG 10.3]
MSPSKLSSHINAQPTELLELDSLDDSELEDSELEDSELATSELEASLDASELTAILDSEELLDAGSLDATTLELLELLGVEELERLLLESLPPQPASVRQSTLKQVTKGNVIFMITSLYSYR